MDVLYLGLAGVLHPCATLYKLLRDRSPWADGEHCEYEGLPVLERALEGWPAVRIVLTSTEPWSKGLQPVLQRLGRLAERVIGYTFEDLTTFAQVPGQRPMSELAYWALRKSEVVRAHRAWLKPSAWAAIDDEDILWTANERRHHLVVTDGCEGLCEPAAQARLMAVLLGNFGLPVAAAPHRLAA
jgi:hypothetical protein